MRTFPCNFELGAISQASTLLQLTATAQQVEMTCRFLQHNQQQRGLAHETCDLQLRLHASLQQLSHLASALYTYGEQNKLCSHQLQLNAGITSKVPAHNNGLVCEQAAEWPYIALCCCRLQRSSCCHTVNLSLLSEQTL